MRLLRLRYLLPLAMLAALGAAGALGSASFLGGAVTVNECCNNTGAATGAPSSAAQYPSTITVPPSLGGNITDVKVTLSLDFNFPQDLDILLVSPHGEKVLLMSDVGGNSNTFVPDTLTLQDGAPAIPDAPTPELTSGTYAPTNGASDCDNQTDPANEGFPLPAPAGPYSGALSAFNGQSAIGTWNLYVIDDCNGIGPDNSISSWGLDLTTDSTTAVRVKTFKAASIRRGISVSWRTAGETDLLGFNIYRSTADKQIKVNRQLIRAKSAGSPAGGSYRLLDRHVRAGITYAYRLQVLSLDGRRSWQGFARVRSK